MSCMYISLDSFSISFQHSLYSYGWYYYAWLQIGNCIWSRNRPWSSHTHLANDVHLHSMRLQWGIELDSKRQMMKEQGLREFATGERNTNEKQFVPLEYRRFPSFCVPIPRRSHLEWRDVSSDTHSIIKGTTWKCNSRVSNMLFMKTHANQHWQLFDEDTLFCE